MPSIPGFNVTFQTYPDYIPPTYGVDPSTGRAVMTKAGYTELEKWVDVNIGSQPFIRYNNSAGHSISLYFDVRWKGNQDSSWQSIPIAPPYQYYGAVFGDGKDAQPVGCLITIGFKGINGPENGNMQLLDPTATKIDFQVEAFIGYYTTDDVFVGQASGWSSTQTLTIPADSTSTSPSSTPTVPELSWLAILPLIIAVLSIAAAFRFRKHPLASKIQVAAV